MVPTPDFRQTCGSRDGPPGEDDRSRHTLTWPLQWPSWRYRTCKVTQYRVAMCHGMACSKQVCEPHPRVVPDPYGATAHRVGDIFRSARIHTAPP
jgi:hypothetical protein